jgi:hypothetical protein
VAKATQSLGEAAGKVHAWQCCNAVYSHANIVRLVQLERELHMGGRPVTRWGLLARVDRERTDRLGGRALWAPASWYLVKIGSQMIGAFPSRKTSESARRLIVSRPSDGEEFALCRPGGGCMSSVAHGRVGEWPRSAGWTLSKTLLRQPDRPTLVLSTDRLMRTP